MALPVRNLRHLETFLVLAEELHFGRTAERLHVAQPAVSQTIAALEADLGLSLFDRSNRQVRLTAAGAAYVAEVEAIFAQVSRADSVARQADAGVRGRLIIGFTAVCTLGTLPERVGHFRAEYPDVAVTLRQLGTAQQIEAIRHGSIDVGFSILPNRHAPVHSEPFSSDELHLFLADDNPLAVHERIAISDALDEPFLLMSREREPCVHETFSRMCDKYGKDAEIVMEIDHVESMLAFVASGLGVSLAPSLAANLHLDGATSRPLDPPVPSGISVMWDPAAATPSTDRFLSILGVGEKKSA